MNSFEKTCQNSLWNGLQCSDQTGLGLCSQLHFAWGDSLMRSTTHSEPLNEVLCIRSNGEHTAQ